MHFIKKNPKETHDKKKIYANQHKEFNEFQVGEHVYLRIKPKKISLRNWVMCKTSTSVLGAFRYR